MFYNNSFYIKCIAIFKELVRLIMRTIKIDLIFVRKLIMTPFKGTFEVPLNITLCFCFKNEAFDFTHR